MPRARAPAALVGSCCPQRASVARGASALAGWRALSPAAPAHRCLLLPAPAALALPLPRPRHSCLLSPRSNPARCPARAAVHASDVNHLFLTRPYPCPKITLTPRTFTRFSPPSRSSLRPLPCVTPLAPQSLTLRTQHLSHPPALSRCASHLPPFTPLPWLQIHCPAMDLLSCPLLLRPQFFGMTPLTCPFTLLLCAAADSISTS